MQHALQTLVTQMLIANILRLVQMEFVNNALQVAVVRLMEKTMQVVQEIVLAHFMIMNLIIALLRAVANGVHNVQSMR